MSRLKNSCLSAALALTVGLPAWSQESVGVNTVVATVNGTEITIGHLAIARANLPEQYKQLPAQTLFDGLLDQLIQQQVLSEKLPEVPLHATMLLANNARQVLANEALTKLLEAEVTDEAVQAAYDAEFAGYDAGQEYNASHILLETEEKAAEVLALAQGGEDFAGLAREYSTGPSGPNGGELGWFAKGMMVAPFEEAVVAMEPGTLSGPVQTQFGWHVIRLNEVRDQAAPTLEEVRDDIVAQLERDAAEGLVARLTGEADVTIVPDIDPAIITDPSIFAK